MFYYSYAYEFELEALITPAVCKTNEEICIVLKSE